MILNNNTTGTHTNTAIQFRRNNVAVGGITFNNASTNYATTSDYRLKENVAGLTNALDRIEKLPVHRFNYKSDPTKTIDGFIAHEVQSVVPEAVIGKKDAIDENGAPVYQQVDYSKVVPLLTAGIRELKAASDKKDAEIAELRKEIEALKNQ
ncbi:MAG: hypothetical protein QG650_335 [Patescibacteria group bacterium]|nr:hypothetical protein [Patescibacteria group bacterium]